MFGIEGVQEVLRKQEHEKDSIMDRSVKNHFLPGDRTLVSSPQYFKAKIGEQVGIVLISDPIIPEPILDLNVCSKRTVVGIQVISANDLSSEHFDSASHCYRNKYDLFHALSKIYQTTILDISRGIITIIETN